MCFHQRLGDGQAEAGTTCSAGPGRISAEKAIEYAMEMFSRNTLPHVADLDDCLVSGVRDSQGHGAARRRVLEGGFNAL